MGCSPPGFSVHRILQASILERVAIFFSKKPLQLCNFSYFFPIHNNILKKYWCIETLHKNYINKMWCRFILLDIFSKIQRYRKMLRTIKQRHNDFSYDYFWSYKSLFYGCLFNSASLFWFSISICLKYLEKSIGLSLICRKNKYTELIQE